MTAPTSPSPDRCNNFPCAMPAGHKGPCSSSPSPDSLAAVVAELRKVWAQPYSIDGLKSYCDRWADRIERLDAEHKAELREAEELIANSFSPVAIRRVEELCAKLAACERDAARYRWLRDHKCNSLHLTRDGDHACNYMTAAEWIDKGAPEWFADDEAGEVQRMRDTNTIWSLQIYPDTPIGFIVANGATLDHVVDALASRADVAEGEK